MRKDTWRGNHHWIPEHGDFAKQCPDLWEEVYGEHTTFMEHDEHVQVQHDTKKYSPIVARSLWELRKFKGNI